jgi:hypothetical protein
VLGLSDVAALRCLFRTLPEDRPGRRISSVAGLAARLGPANAIAATFLGSACRPVRALLLDKNPRRNWALGWHQDRVVAVRARLGVDGFSSWTMKAGIHHAAPPFSIIERMLTLRLHIDDAGPANAPLLVAPGSHRFGAVAERDIAGLIEGLGTRSCLARAGDIWVHAAPILHASERAVQPARRRVLQLSYSADGLPGGLEWLGI